jgi:mRNA interferase RelE/StbE
MSYRLDYLPSAAKSIEKLPKSIQRRILERLEILASNPRGPGSVKFTGEDAYRIRVGDYRVIYTIQDERLIVLVIDVGHRREVYRKK